MSETVLHQPRNAATAAAMERWKANYRRGPVRTRWTKVPLQRGDAAPDLELVEARSGERRRLSSLWANGPAVVLFWRHFGCGCGRDRSKRLAEEYGSFVAAGATVGIVAQCDDPERARMYARANGIPEGVAIFCDPDESAYRAYDLLDFGPVEIFFDAPDEFLRCDLEACDDIFAKRDAMGMPLVDNTWLMPGEFVVDREGRFHLTYRFQYCENWLDPRVVVGTIRYATGELRFER